MACNPPASGMALLGCCPEGATAGLAVRMCQIYINWQYVPSAREEINEMLSDELNANGLPAGANQVLRVDIYLWGDRTERTRDVFTADYPYTYPGAITMVAQYPNNLNGGQAFAHKYILDNPASVCREIYKSFPRRQTDCAIVTAGNEVGILADAADERNEHILWDAAAAGYPDCCNQAP